MKLDYQDKIDDYLLNRMSDEERLAFEKEVGENAELREQLEYTRSIQEAVTSRSEMLAVMHKWEDDYREERVSAAAFPAEVPPHPSKKRLVYWISGAAAVFVIGMLLLIKPTGSHPDLDPNIEVVLGQYRGGSDYSTIKDMLQQKCYEEVLAYIDLEADSIRMDSIEIIMDQSLTDEDLEDEMMSIKERRDEIKWLKVQALIGLNRQEEALLLLDELRDAECDYKRQADSLFNQINQR